MHRTLHLLALVALYSPSAGGEMAVVRSSPRQEVTLALAGRRIAIDYGRPARAGRPIFGGLVPYGEIWRTGADEATQLTTEADLLLAGGLFVPKGSYSLFTVPGEERWLLIVSGVAEQWGAFNYDPEKDLGRAALRVERLESPIERFSITLQATGERSGVLWLGWERTVLSIPFEVLPEPAPPEPAIVTRRPAARPRR